MMALLASGAVASAAAPGRPRVVVLMVDPAVVDPLVARIEAELRSVGLTVRRIEIDSGSDLEAVVTQAIAGGASAALRIIPRSKGTEVWTGDTRARVLRRRAINSSASDAALSILAFRSVEFLRASLLEVPASVLHPAAEPPRPNAARPAPPPVVAAPPRTRPASPPSVAAAEAERQPVRNVTRPADPPSAAPPRDDAATREAKPRPEPPPLEEEPIVTLESRARRPAAPIVLPNSTLEAVAGPVIWVGSRQLPAVPALAVAVRYHLSRAFSVGPSALVPFAAQTLTTPEGTSAIRLLHLGLLSELAFAVSAMVRLQVGASVGAVHLRAAGTDALHGLGKTDATWDVAGGVSVGAKLSFTRFVAVRMDVGGGAVGRRIQIAHAARDAATWGPFYGVAGVALEAGF